MYLKKIVLKNIKCFKELELDFSDGESVRKWTTLFGKKRIRQKHSLAGNGGGTCRAERDARVAARGGRVAACWSALRGNLR